MCVCVFIFYIHTYVYIYIYILNIGVQIATLDSLRPLLDRARGHSAIEALDSLGEMNRPADAWGKILGDHHSRKSDQPTISN